jgi:hypothetical protein
MTATARRFREPSATEAIYIKTATQVISRSLVDGGITETQFRAALAGLETAFVILRAKIAGGHFAERSPGEAAPLRWLPAAQVTAEGIYDDLLNTSLDLARSLYAISVLDHGPRFEVFMLSSHAVTDATSLVALHAALIYLCDCAVRGAEPTIAVQAFPETIDDAVARCLAALGVDETTVAAPAWEGPFLHLPMLMAAEAAVPSRVRHRVERFVIEPDAMRPIAAAGHSHGVSVHALLGAAFVKAIAALSGVEGRQMVVRSAIDVRRRLDPHISVELVFSAVTAHVTRIEPVEASIFEIAKTIFADIHTSDADGRIFLDYRNYPNSFASTRTDPTAISLSDMGKVAFHAAIETLAPTGFEYATGWMKRYPNVSITIFEGRLVATMTYVEAFIAPPVMRRLAELVVQVLAECETASVAA